MRSSLRTVSAVLALALPLLFLASAAMAEEESRPSALSTILYTWAPVLIIVALWLFFMRFMRNAGGGVKGGYKAYLRSSQERIESIDQSLQRIATQLERLVEVADRPK